MCEVRSTRKTAKNQKKKKGYSNQQQREMDCDEPHLAPNEKMQPIQWTEWPTGALVAVGSLLPRSIIDGLVPTMCVSAEKIEAS